jgi:hypothetical protein
LLLSCFDLLYCNAAIQGSNSPSSCSKSDIVQATVIMVTLPMTKPAFIAKKDKYIDSVATSAGVSQENVEILNVEEVSTRTSRIISARSLLAISVQVQTSILTPTGQPTRIEDQTVFNSNLIRNGLPSGTLVVQYTYLSFMNTTTPAAKPGSGAETPTVNVTTPVPWPGAAKVELETASGSSGSPNVPVGAIAGGVVGFLALVTAIFLAWRLKNFMV